MGDFSAASLRTSITTCKYISSGSDTITEVPHTIQLIPQTWALQESQKWSSTLETLGLDLRFTAIGSLSCLWLVLSPMAHWRQNCDESLLRNLCLVSICAWLVTSTKSVRPFVKYICHSRRMTRIVWKTRTFIQSFYVSVLTFCFIEFLSLLTPKIFRWPESGWWTGWQGG